MEHSKKLDLSISAADLKRIEQILDYHFSRPERVALALTHSSWANEHGLGQAHNERLEFLGDAVLELCISWELFTRFPQAREGEMTRVRSQLVGTTSLAQRARETGIDQLLRLGRGEEQQGGRSRDAVLSDVFEAVLASVYEDGGYAAAQKVVARLFKKLLDEVSVGKPKTKTHTYRGIGHYLRFTEYPPQHIGIIKNYTDYLLKKTDKFIAPGEQGITGLTFSNAIHLASWTGREVTIPIDEEKFLAELEERKREEEKKTPNKKS